MGPRKLWAPGLLLALQIFVACGSNPKPNQPISTKGEAKASTAAEKDKNLPATGIQPSKSDTGPGDPNILTRTSGTAFPNVSFSLEGIPAGESYHYVFKVTPKADPSISHYAYKIETVANSCKQPGGYTVYDAKSVIDVNIERFAMGAIYLCAIAYHFPTKQWQDVTQAHAYVWNKVPFKRVFDTYWTLVDANCNNITVKVPSKLTIDGSQGTYTWARPVIANCQANTTPFTDLVSKVVVTDAGMEGAWHEGAVTTGWFKITWVNPDRTAFKGVWGVGVPGGEARGSWNSVGQ